MQSKIYNFVLSFRLEKLEDYSVSSSECFKKGWRLKKINWDRTVIVPDELWLKVETMEQ